MLKERLQILVDPDQRRRLDEEARRRGISVGAVVRDALDRQLGGVSRERRIRAVERMGRRRAVAFAAPEELEAIVAEEREANVDPQQLGDSGADREQ